MRDYQKLSENYSQLLSKKLDAEMAARLERQQKGQQFRVLDPAYLPGARRASRTAGCSRSAALGVGLLLGIGLADHGRCARPDHQGRRRACATAFSFPVLAVIPYVKPKEQARLAKLTASTRTPATRGGRRQGASAREAAAACAFEAARPRQSSRSRSK